MQMKQWWCAAALAALAAGSAHAQLAASANDNKIVLVNGVPTVVQKPQPDTVALIDLRARPASVLRHIEVKTSVVGPPMSVAIAPDESLMLVTAAMKIDPADAARLVPDNKLSVVDLKTDPPAVIAELEAGAGAAGVSITRDGRLALVANRNEGTISVFRIEGTAVRKVDTVAIARPEAGVAHVAIAPDGRSALVMRDGDHTISVLAIAGEKVTYAGRDFGAGLKPYGAVITPDGRFAVIANLGLGRGDNDTVSLVDLALQPARVVETYTVGQTPEGIAISPDGKLVAVVTMNGSNKPSDSPFHSAIGRVVLMRVLRDRLQIVSDAPIGAWPQGAAFSGDGTLLLVQSMSERNIMVLAIDKAMALRDTGQRIPLRGGGAALRVADQPKRQ
jgi:DNA-binding beta-propeller fold protein YncE